MTFPRQIALLIPKLASDHDGEIVGTVKAIERVLQASGLDWHDLAKAIESGPARREPPPRQEKQKPHTGVHQTHIDTYNAVVRMAEEIRFKFSEREHEFLDSLGEQLKERAGTAKQVAWLSDIHIKVERAWKRRKKS